MAKTYIAADMRLFDRDMAKKFGMSIERYNKKVIEKINETVTDEDDYILLNGVISMGSVIGTLHLLSQIKAKTIVLKRDAIQQFGKDEWLKSCNLVCSTDGSQRVDINGEECILIILAGKEYLEKYLQLPNVYVAGAASILDIDEIYKKPLLNISLSEWNFEPIEIGERLPQIIDDMELFASMDDNKEEILS